MRSWVNRGVACHQCSNHPSCKLIGAYACQNATVSEAQWAAQKGRHFELPFVIDTAAASEAGRCEGTAALLTHTGSPRTFGTSTPGHEPTESGRHETQDTEHL